MAAVTQNNTPSKHISGDVVEHFYNISGASGSTLQLNQSNILHIASQPGSLITGIAQSTTAGVGTLLTFTSSAPMVNEVLRVASRVG